MKSQSNLKNFKIIYYPNSSFTLVTPLFISNLVLPIFCLLAFGLVFIIRDVDIYLFAMSLVSLGLVYRIWHLFDPINIIVADRSARCFKVRPRNILKRIFFREIVFSFQDIKQFVILIGSDHIFDSDRYIITAIQKDSSQIAFTHSTNKEVAQKVLELMQDALHWNQNKKS